MVLYDPPIPDSCPQVCSESGNVFLSGIGLYDDPCDSTFLVPRSQNKTYEDLRSGEVPGTEIADVDYSNIEDTDGNYYDPFEGVWGFVFHDACWKLLDALYGKEDVPLGRLHAVLRSLPHPMGMLGASWGHTYGGIQLPRNEDEKLWDCMFFLSERDDNEPGNAAPCNPLRIPEIERPHRKCRRDKDPFLQFAWEQQEVSGKDPFARLPPEIIRMVADLLRVRDVGAARRASRAFIPVFHDQKFWRTRFEARGELAWLFEARRDTGGGKELDWRNLYRRMRRRNLSLQELNRARIWSILEDTRDVLSLEWLGRASSPPGLGATVGNGDVLYRHWLTVSGTISDSPPANGICGNQSVSYRLREEVIHLPGTIKAIHATIVRLEETTYLTGISVMLAGHDSIQVGYQGPWGQESLDVTDSNGGYVNGFNLAVGRYGIQALQCIFPNENTSRWIGSPEGVPASRLSAPNDLVRGLKVEFDVRTPTHESNQPMAKTCLLTFCWRQDFKIVAFSIPTMQPGCGTKRIPIWYPQVPPQTLDTHLEFVTAQDDEVFNDYQPLHWIAFGGADGRYLKNLTSVASPSRSLALILNFRFDSDAVPSECRQMAGYTGDAGSDPASFLIDGPRGEIIRQVDVISQISKTNANGRRNQAVFGIKVRRVLVARFRTGRPCLPGS